MSISRALFMALSLSFAFVANAQWVPSAAFNSMAPQHRDWRITGQPDHGYFSFLSNGSFWASNTLAHPATWLVTVPGQSSPQIDLNAIFEDVAGSNALEAKASFTLFNAGVFLSESRNTFVDFAATENVQARVGLPGDVLRLPFTGNASFDGATSATIDLAPMDVSLLHHRSFSCGVQHAFSERLRAGLRVHRLHGFHHLAIEENRWGLTTHAADWSWNLNGGGRIVSSGLNAIYQAHVSGQMDSLVEALPDQLSSTPNKGWGADAGLEVQWTERFSTWFQYNHGGTIQWSNDVLAYEVEAFDWELEGFDATNSGNGWVDGVDALSDSVELWAENEFAAIETYHAASESNAAYEAKLPNRLVAGAEYSILRGEQGSRISIGGMVERNGQRPMSWNIAVNARMGNGLQSTLTYGNRYGLVSTAGVSLAMPVGPLLVFAAAEGHQALDWSHFTASYDDQFKEWSMPTEAPYLAAQAGVVWRLNWRNPKSTPAPEPLAPFQNSTRSPALGFEVQLDDEVPEAQPCALPGDN